MGSQRPPPKLLQLRAHDHEDGKLRKEQIELLSSVPQGYAEQRLIDGQHFRMVWRCQ
ncbi:MAG: hypothetical protein KTR25_06695 [Myxococcales bacterium]|nr:hypothetical protein [Myxococcales bacterium]